MVKPQHPADSPRKSSPVVKRSITIAGRNTSVGLEDAFWNALKEIAANRNMSPANLIATINNERQHGNLSSAIRLFVLDHYRRLAEFKRKEE
jgi:predicted DNA-binding ribbon-helix-helix protein